MRNAGFGAAGSATHMQGNADGDHEVDGADFLAWQRQLGSSTPAFSANSPVPEPVTWLLSLLAAASISRISGRMHQELACA